MSAGGDEKSLDGSLAELVDRRSSLSLAHQVFYQTRVLTMLTTLAISGKGGLVIERLRDPAKMARWYADTFES